MMAFIFPVDKMIVGIVLKSRGFVVIKTWGRILVQPHVSLEDLGTRVTSSSQPWFLPHKISTCALVQVCEN